MAAALFDVAITPLWSRWRDDEAARHPDDRDPENLLARVEQLVDRNLRQDIQTAQALFALAHKAIPSRSPLAERLDEVGCKYYLGLIQAAYDESPAERAAWAAAALDFGAQATAINADATSPHSCRAGAFGALERWDEGMAEARHVVALPPATAESYEALAFMELGKGDLSGALEDLTEVGFRAGSAPRELGFAELMLRDDAAIQTLREVAVADPSDVWSPFFLAAAYQLSRRHAEAVEAAQRYRRLKTNDAIWRTLSYSHQPGFSKPVGVIRKALHDAGLDEPASTPNGR